MSDNIQIKIPLNWELISIKESINKYPLTGKKLNQKEYEKEGLFPVIDQGQSYIGGYSNRNDLIISSENPFIIFGDHTLKIKFINFDFIAGADGVKVFQAKKFFYPKLFYYFSQAVKFPHKGYARHFQFFEKAEIPLPPLAEQHRIVEKIEEEFTRLDAGVAALKRAKALIPKYRQSVLKAAMCGDLTKEWRALHPDVESAEVLVEKKSKTYGSNQNLSERSNKFDINNKLPNKWVLANSKEIGIINPKKNLSNIKDSDIVSFIPMKCVSELSGEIDLSEQKRLQEVKKGYTQFINGDILFAKITPCMENGKVALVNDLINSIGFGSTEFHIFRFNSRLNRKFFFYYLIQEGFRRDAKRKMTGSAGQLRVPKSFLENIMFPLPPLEEQHEIVSEIERRFSIIDEMERVVEESLLKAERLRQSVLKKAFEGRLVEQSPDDEPAGVLLERIKAEKELRAAEGKANGKKKSAGKKKIKKKESE
ncbi:restriction endonuclease subunit S [Methanomicrobium antiquum]|uniref:Restriction endonuclease subunit S n=1 Tax=Methanomicrobium antiquum TaxID=487686 RepID=A0AAF0JMW5_9EURY|nr:restriction endonuclease subunit S [Methanomicrobium antiquum]WFN36985.1 restriction endonuclease subunit S [Methanomicrobium antiquum]